MGRAYLKWSTKRPHARTKEETSGFAAEKRQVSLTELSCRTCIEILSPRDKAE